MRWRAAKRNDPWRLNEGAAAALAGDSATARPKAGGGNSRNIDPRFPVTSGRLSGNSHVDRVDEYRRFAEACVEMARHQESPHNRAVLLQMAYIWSRLAEQAAAFAKPEAK